MREYDWCYGKWIQDLTNEGIVCRCVEQMYIIEKRWRNLRGYWLEESADGFRNGA